MISHIKIQNFQSWEEIQLDFSSGVNAILGQSDKGKSSIFRALNWVAFNRPLGTEFCSDWGGDTVVEIGLDKGPTIRRVRSSSKNYYQIIKNGKEGEPLKALASRVPPEILQLLNLSSINLQYQMDAPFLLSETSGEVGRRLNEVAGLEAIDSASKNINSWLRVENRTLKTRQEDLEGERDKLEGLSWLSEAEEELVGLEKLGAKLERKRTRKYQLENLLGELVENQGKLETFRDIGKKGNRLNDLIQLDSKLNELREDHAELQVLIKQIKSRKVRREVYLKIMKAEPKVVGLNQLSEELEELEELEEELVELCISIKGLRRALVGEKLKRELMEKEFHKLMPDECPLCGRSGE